MGYVVKAVSASGCQMWVLPPRDKTHSNFGPRRDAQVFRTEKDAQAAVEKLPDCLRLFGFEFKIESAS